MLRTRAFKSLGASTLRWAICCAAVCLPAVEVSVAFGADETVVTEQGASSAAAEKVQARIKRIEAATDLDSALKTKLLELYKKTLEQLKVADDWAAKTAAIHASRAKDPEDLAKLKAQLEEASAEASPDVPPNASLAQLEQKLAEAEANLKNRQQQLTLREGEPKRRRAELPQLLADCQQRLKDVDAELASLPPATDTLDLPEARRCLVVAVKSAVEQELAAYDTERLWYEANSELITARQDVAALELREADATAKRCRELLNERRAQEAVAQATEARRAAMDALPALKMLAEKNAELTEEQNSPNGFPAKISGMTREIEEVNRELANLTARFNRVRDKIAAAGLTDAIGLLLQKHQADLPDLRSHRQRIHERQAEISQVKAKLIELEDQRADLSDLEPHVRRVMATVDSTLSSSQQRDIEAALRELLKSRQGYLESQIADANTYINSLVIDLDVTERRLVTEIEAYGQFIKERILWVRSAPPLTVDDGPRAWEGLLRLADGEQWSAMLRELWRDARDNSGWYVLAAWALLPLLVAQRRLRHRIDLVDHQTAQTYCADIRPTIEVLLLTISLAAIWPLTMSFLAWRIALPAAASPHAQCIAFALRTSAVLYFSLELVRQSCRRRGLGEAHFGWPVAAVSLVRQHLGWAMLLGLPLAFLVAVVESPEVEFHRSSLGRLAFVGGLLVLIALAHAVLHPKRGLVPILAPRHEGSWLWRQARAWHLLACCGLMALVIIACLGYFYTALHLTWRLQAMVWLLLGLVYVQALALRSLLVARRKLAIKQARERRAASLSGIHALPSTVSGEIAACAPIKPVDLGTIDLQTRRLLRSCVWMATVVGCWAIWIDVLPALEILNHWQLWPYTTEVSETVVTAGGHATTLTSGTDWITLGDLLLCGVCLLMTVVAGRNLPGLLEIAFLQRLPLDPGGRYAITAVSRYVITLVGISLALWMIGIGWSNVKWLAAAMTVGLGFGLQEIFANFVSGLIILFERPMRVGDTVTVGGINGTVTRIRIRATTITDWDRKELIVPNREFITGQLVNWTLSDSTLRLIMHVGVAYGSDVALVQQLLLQVAHEEPKVLKDPQPKALFVQFGESTLDFELRVFVAGLDEYMNIRHELNASIDQAFRAASVEIAFPQREIRLRSVEPVAEILPGFVESRKRAS